MRYAWVLFIAAANVAKAQVSGSTLAWSGVGEATGEVRSIGRGQPAALAWNAGTLAEISAVPHVHGLSGLRYAGVGFAMSDGGFGWGFSMSALKAGQTDRSEIGMALGWAALPSMAVGVAARIGRWDFPRYGGVYEGDLGLGVQSRTDFLTTGASITVSGQQYRKVTVRDLRFAIGGVLQLSEWITTVAEAVDAGFLELRMGARAVLREEVSIILSWSDGSETVGAGLDLRVEPWRALVGARWHPLLGWSTGVDLQFKWR